MRSRSSVPMPRPSSSRIWLSLAERFFDSRQHRGLEFFSGFLRCRIHRSRHAQDDVQIGLAGDAELVGRRAEGLHVAGNQLAVERDAVAARVFQAQGHLDVAARQFFFQQAAQLHLQRVGIRGQAEVQVEKTMVDRLQRQAQTPGRS